MLAIIQARTSSRRLKNKILYKINGRPLIWHVIAKVKKSKKISKIVVSTSTSKSDDKLVKYLINIKMNYFRGDLHNVAKRLLNTALHYKKNFFLRINGDSPLIDSKIMDKIILISKKKSFKNYDLITNVFPRTFPKGQSVEIIKTKTLKYFVNDMNLNEAEHVTKYFYRNHLKFKIKNFESNKYQGQIKLSVDTKKDLIRIKKILKNKNNYGY